MCFIYQNEKKPVHTRGNVRKDTKKHEIAKTYLKLQKLISLNTSSLRDFNNPYLEDDLANLRL